MYIFLLNYLIAPSSHSMRCLQICNVSLILCFVYTNNEVAVLLIQTKKNVLITCIVDFQY